MSSEQLILFDCDGTIVDSQHQIIAAMHAAFSRNGLTAPDTELIRSVIGLSLTIAVERLAPDLDMDKNLLEMVLATYRQAYVAFEPGLSLYEGVREGLESLRDKGYLLGIVTGKSRKGLLRVLDTFDLHPLFQVWRTADCCPSKPNPAMVLECMQELCMEPDSTLVVGDACFDMEMACAAGVKALGVSFGVESAERLTAAGAVHVFRRFDEISSWFPRLEAGMAAA